MSFIKKIKNKGKAFVLWYLTVLVKHRLKKLKVDIIGVTGSVGKTSTKDAIYCVLARRNSVLRNQKSYNTDFGILLALLEQESGFSSPYLWIEVLIKAFKVAFWGKKDYSKIVMEMGVDKPGDMDVLLKIIKPSIGVLTAIKPIHLAEGQFANLEAILAEKSKMVRRMGKNEWAILNIDDHYLSIFVSELDANIITYGVSEKANIRASNVESSEEGLKFNLSFDDKNFQVHLPNLIGKHHVYVVLPAIAIGFLSGLKWETIKAGLDDFKLPPGRLNLIPGINKSTIMDGSYNASPETMLASIEVLKEMRPKGIGKRIAVLGNMNELGDLTDSEHRRIGMLIPKSAEMLVTVGESAKLYAEEAVKGGMEKGSVFSFDDSKVAGEFLKGKIKIGDIVLVKGSQNKVRLERLVKEIMAEPERARELLVRQEESWEERT
ncbi:MAG: UDP-N-acetylmuramoyl-tripeptide--D-alanyl-D-alanine ligase [Candidatus Gracilibacteria bacterium]|jgi:UDP-N-acetylmuramoyl-tripeptide--D-alanyl-D-alanine ligase